MTTVYSTTTSVSLSISTQPASTFTTTQSLTLTATATATSLSLSLRPASTVVQISTTTAYSYITTTSYPPQTTVYAPASTVTVTASNRGAAASSTRPYSAFTTDSYCPDINNQDITDVNGNVYTMRCSSDTTIGAFANRAANNGYSDCFAICDSTAGCVAFAYGEFSSSTRYNIHVTANENQSVVKMAEEVSHSSSFISPQGFN